MRKFGIILLVTALAVIVFNFVFSFFISGKTNEFITDSNNRPIIIAHGGSKQLYPENTMEAFDGSVSIGVDMLEMDVMLTKDNILITQHDDTIDRMTDGKGYVNQYTYEELKKFNFGYGFKDLNGYFTYRDKKVSVTSLEDVIKKHGHRYSLSIEIKNTGKEGEKACEELYRLLKENSVINKVIVSSFDDNIIKYFKQISAGEVKTATSRNSTKRFVVLNKISLNGYFFSDDDALQIPVSDSGFDLDKQSLIKAAHKKNMAVHYWTINEEEEMKRLIEMGADGLITDRPDIMKKVLQEMGFSVGAP